MKTMDRTSSTTAKPANKAVPTVSVLAARLSAVSAATFVVLLGALHFLKPELDPSWRMISEYEIGNYGWLMVLAFLALALSCGALFAAIRTQVQTVGGRVGLALLLVGAAGMTLAAFAKTDPITATTAELTTHGSLHGLGSMLGIPSIPIAAALITWSLGRNPAWSAARNSLRWTTVLTWLGLLGFLASVALTLPKNDGKFGPEVVMGWPNRFLIVAYAAWLITVSWRALQLRRTHN